MERVTLRVPEQHIKKAEELVDRGEFPNRSEVIRSFIRQGLRDYNFEADDPPWFKK